MENKVYARIGAALLCLLLLFCGGCLREVNKSLTLKEAEKMYYEGDHPRAFRLTEVLALEGDKNSQYALGYMYYYGIGAPQNKPLAIAWMIKAAKQGHASANIALNEIQAAENSVSQIS